MKTLLFLSIFFAVLQANVFDDNSTQEDLDAKLNNYTTLRSDFIEAFKEIDASGVQRDLSDDEDLALAKSQRVEIDDGQYSRYDYWSERYCYFKRLLCLNSIMLCLEDECEGIE
ncbi:MAG: hypothetical protein JXQ76_11000 [Campylobacterales bacterium]|nr:hypothetical protein [Campylobacterales bacterium]